MGRAYQIPELYIYIFKMMMKTGMGTLHAWQSFGDGVAVRLLIFIHS